MKCKKCGAECSRKDSHCAQCGEKIKKGPPLVLQLVLKLLSALLCLALTFSLLATALLLDVRLLTSSGGIEKILTSALTSKTPSSQGPTTAPTAEPDMSGPQLNRLSDITYPEGYTVDEDGNIIAPDGSIVGNINDTGSSGDFTFSLDMLTDPDALAELLCSVAQEYLGEDTDITPEQIKTFVEESTLIEFVSDKVASYTQDMLNGTQNTSITPDEIMQLVEDNQALIEETFRVEITQEQKGQINQQINQVLEETDLNNSIHEGISAARDMQVPALGNASLGDMMELLNQLAQPKLLIIAVGACLALLLLLLALNYYSLSQWLQYCASGFLSAGATLALPLLVLQFAPALITKLMPAMENTMTLAAGVVPVMAPIHYGILIAGIVLTVLSFLCRLKAKK